jgi:hypothetical protein
MKATFSLFCLTIGAILLSLDRLVDKNRVIEIDKKIEYFINKFRLQKKAFNIDYFNFINIDINCNFKI